MPSFRPNGGNVIYTITGTTALSTGGQLTLGGGTGGTTFNLVANGNFQITPANPPPQQALPTGVTVFGGAQINHTSGDFIVADYFGSVGSLDIRGAGRVIASGAAVRIARQASSQGSITVTGVNSIWQITAPVFDIGFAGDADVTINNGGSLLSANTSLGSGFFSSSTVEVTGSSSSWLNSGDLTFRRAGALNISRGARVTIGGTADLAENNSSISLFGGTLTADTIDRAGGGAFNFTGGTLHTNTFIGDLTNAGGTLAPGASPGTTTISGGYTQQADGALEIELAGLLEGEFDRLLIQGDAALDGTLTVDVLTGFTPDLGDTFEILDIAGTLTGQFAGLDEGALLPAVDGAQFQISYLGGDGNDVVLTAVPEPGTLALLGLGGFTLLLRRRSPVIT
ncbi:MAG: PEP-CTERM sorting domain-containing protein [Phycisphaeraceae bacterium]|nr:PEP-CTERM sorting domain-containing protein [Phycisphaeraceae bacterium]